MGKKTGLILAIDIGNTSISYGLFKFGRLIHKWHGGIDIIPKIRLYIKKCGINCNMLQIIVDSVNPKKMNLLSSVCKKQFSNYSLSVIGKDIFVKINHKYININNLGKDRIVNIYGAIKKYRLPAVVIDLGTATTVDFISKKGVFEGGLIIPGMEISLEALWKRTALLPRLRRIAEAKAFIGKDTKDCMMAGLLQGTGAMLDGLIERFKKRYRGKITIIMTGGLAGMAVKYMESKVILDLDHTIKSLELIYQDFDMKKEASK